MAGVRDQVEKAMRAAKIVLLFEERYLTTSAPSGMTQKLLGHSTPAVTAVYAAADPTKAAPTVNGLHIGP
jgi:integrase